MFDTLPLLPPDSILGLSAACRQDPNPSKVDLTVGIYMDEQGVCPVFEAVKQAQRNLVEHEVSKAYISPVGDEAFNAGMQRLVFGDSSPVLAEGRIGSVQTPGGCGALRIGAELIHAASPGSKVWLSDPTWPVHIPLLGSVGLEIETYRYYNPETHGVDFDDMVADLARAKAGDVVMIHGCCHNPCGADLNLEQWGVVADIAERQGLIPFIDTAYLGLGDGLEEDAAGLRLLVERLPEVIVAASCSKSMGLYRERTGAVMFSCKNSERVEAVVSQALVAARRVYSMSPAHGAILAGQLLSNEALNQTWKSELKMMCGRINGLRNDLVNKLNAVGDRDFGFIAKEKGMFSFLGLTQDQTRALREDYSVYMLDSSRINVAGVNATNIDYLAQSIGKVL
ncbi:MAG: aromatic amino acid transaminase [Halioglobus sp.]